MKKERDLYKLLEVPRTADTEQIRAAMLKLSKKYTTQKRLDATTRAYFEEIKMAYQVLSSPYRRAAYDISLEEEELSQEESQRYLTQFFEKWKKKNIDSVPADDTLPIKTQKMETYLQTSWQNLSQKKAYLHALFQRHKKRRKQSRQFNALLMPDEVVKYQATLHWLLYVEIGALLLILVPSYFLLDVPDFVDGNTPTVSLWLVERMLKSMREFSVWNLGLLSLIVIGALMWTEVIILKKTTELVITSKRIIIQLGLFNRRVTELKLMQFESITVDQSLLGRFFDYGKLTITGASGVKITASHVVAPLAFRQTLWHVLEQMNTHSAHFNDE